MDKIEKIDKTDLTRKNSEPLKEVEISPVKKRRPLSVRQMINKIEKIEELKKEGVEESKPVETVESVNTVAKDEISVIPETSEYDDSSKRAPSTIMTSPCKSKEVGYKVTKANDKLGDYNQLDVTGKSLNTLNQSNFNINSTFNSERCGDNILYTSPNVENKVKVVDRLETPNKLSCFRRVMRCFKK